MYRKRLTTKTTDSANSFINTFFLYFVRDRRQWNPTCRILIVRFNYKISYRWLVYYWQDIIFWSSKTKLTLWQKKKKNTELVLAGFEPVKILPSPVQFEAVAPCCRYCFMINNGNFTTINTQQNQFTFTPYFQGKSIVGWDAIHV